MLLAELSDDRTAWKEARPPPEAPPETPPCTLQTPGCSDRGARTQPMITVAAAAPPSVSRPSVRPFADTTVSEVKGPLPCRLTQGMYSTGCCSKLRAVLNIQEGPYPLRGVAPAVEDGGARLAATKNLARWGGEVIIRTSSTWQGRAGLLFVR